MERLQFFLAGVIVAVLAASVESGDTGSPGDLSLGDMCDSATCCTGTMCRVVQTCAGPSCSPESECLTCVPEGVDSVCNANQYLFALLVGDASKPGELTERKCDPGSATPECPTGSWCIDDGEGRGTCCYDFVTTAIDTNQAICPTDECGGCEPGYFCKTYTGILSFIGSRCVKEKVCPTFPQPPPSYCREKPDLCSTDDDCQGYSRKCCSDRCGRLVCTRGV